MKVEVVLTEADIAQEFAEAIEARDLPEKFFFWFTRSAAEWAALGEHAELYGGLWETWKAIAATAPELAKHFGGRVPVISFGSGNGARDRLLMGALNAFTDEVGKGTDIFTGEAGLPIAKIARKYRSRGARWLIVGDRNYGEGSSREHAALCPRLLGGAAVIARSFARIHESNLKKQGLLALTFQDPADYDRIRVDDRLSLVGLAGMAPGKPVECRIKHADGTSETLYLNHTFSTSQLEWFRKGSALNLFQH